MSEVQSGHDHQWLKEMEIILFSTNLELTRNTMGVISRNRSWRGSTLFWFSFVGILILCLSSSSSLPSSNSERPHTARFSSRSPRLTEGINSGFFRVLLLDNVRMVILMILPSNGPRRSFCSSADLYKQQESHPLTPLKAIVRSTSSTLRLSRTFRILS